MIRYDLLDSSGSLADDSPCTFASDVYSFGIIMNEIET